MLLFSKKFIATLVVVACAMSLLASTAVAGYGVASQKIENVSFTRAFVHHKWVNNVSYWNGTKWKTESAKKYGAGLIVKHGAVTIKLIGDEVLLSAVASYGTNKTPAHGFFYMWPGSVAYKYAKLEGASGHIYRIRLQAVTADVYNPEMPEAPSTK